SCLQTQVIERAAIKHWSMRRSGATEDLEDIPVAVVGDLDHRQDALVTHLLLGEHLGIEDALVELDEPSSVSCDHRDVVETIQQHRNPPAEIPVRAPTRPILSDPCTESESSRRARPARPGSRLLRTRSRSWCGSATRSSSRPVQAPDPAT